jgi:hypothetical protein
MFLLNPFVEINQFCQIAQDEVLRSRVSDIDHWYTLLFCTDKLSASGAGVTQLGIGTIERALRGTIPFSGSH